MADDVGTSSSPGRSVADAFDNATRNVVLTGFMGTGKTTIGRVLASRLDFEFVDTDQLIELQHGSIPDIFRSQGEAAFRSFEHDVAVALSARRSLVISTGGRLLLDADNAEVLMTTGRVFCLTASVDTILARVMSGDPTHRPLLLGDNVRERVETLFAERAAGYARFTQISTEERTISDIVEEILSRL